MRCSSSPTGPPLLVKVDEEQTYPGWWVWGIGRKTTAKEKKNKGIGCPLKMGFSWILQTIPSAWLSATHNDMYLMVRCTQSYRHTSLQRSPIESILLGRSIDLFSNVLIIHEQVKRISRAATHESKVAATFSVWDIEAFQRSISNKRSVKNCVNLDSNVLTLTIDPPQRISSISWNEIIKGKGSFRIGDQYKSVNNSNQMCVALKTWSAALSSILHEPSNIDRDRLAQGSLVSPLGWFRMEIVGLGFILDTLKNDIALAPHWPEVDTWKRVSPDRIIGKLSIGISTHGAGSFTYSSFQFDPTIVRKESETLIFLFKDFYPTSSR